MFRMQPMIGGDFPTSMKNRAVNTLNFENCSNQQEYANINMMNNNATSRSLRMWDITPLTKLAGIFAQTASIETFTTDQQQIYQFRPKRLSLRFYGVSDFWWIIMAVNGIYRVEDFTNFSSLIIPDKQTMIDEIDSELFSNPVSYKKATQIG